MTVDLRSIPDLIAGATFALGGGVLMAASFGWLSANEDLLYAGAGALLLVRAVEFWVSGIGMDCDCGECE